MIVPPLSTIGIIGGGQLGRMLALAAAELGYRCHIYAPDERSPAAEVADKWTRAAYDDEAAMRKFAESVDIITYEFENIPVAPVEALTQVRAVHPNPGALAVAQDRAAEKAFADRLGARTAPWMEVDSREALDAAIAHVGLPAILKTRRDGYDGKGQARLLAAGDADRAWDEIGGRPAILEGFVRFDREFSVILARSADGQVAFWDTPENVHRDGILDSSTVPADPMILGQAKEARELASRVAAELGYVGVLTLEFFASADGPVFNEMAPRVHNSGHWTIEGATCSQFENHIRAVCGLPLGSTKLVTAGAVMHNLIGEDANNWSEILSEAGAHLHLYGKRSARKGRKMGHVTRLQD